MRLWMSFFACIMITLVIPLSFADSPVGNWTTIDEKTGAKRAVINLSISENTLTGTIVRVNKQSGDSERCEHCAGVFKNKLVKGLQFIWGFKNKGKDEWVDGKILDPSTGKIYSGTMTQQGNKLVVRGYLGVSLLGRTQVWIR